VAEELEAQDIVRRGYDAIGERYREWARTFVSPAGRYLAELEARLPDDARVLDLGCGPGIPAAELGVRHRLTCVDLSEVQLELARQAAPGATFLHADMAELDLPPASFDAVVALFSILHLAGRDQPPLLERIGRWLAPNGLFLASLGVRENTGVLDLDWLGAPMYSSSLGTERYLELLAAARLEVLEANVETQIEHGPTVAFLWVLARKPA
jgi:SAM-dependent methyltransferase